MESSKDPCETQVSACQICPKTDAPYGNRNRATPKPKPSPCRVWGQGAKTVQFWGVAVGDVEIGADLGGELHYSNCDLAGIFC